MPKLERQHLVLGLVLLILVLLYLVSVAVGQDDGRAQPEGSKLENLESVLSSFPGLGNKLAAEDVWAQCFDNSNTFTATPVRPCEFDVPDGVDRVSLVRVEGQCDVVISDQPDVFDQLLPTTGWDDNKKDLSLVGEGAVITISVRGQDERCRLRLVP